MIEELYARYNHCIDSDRFDEWVSLFTPDGVFASTTTHAGSAELRTFVRARAAAQNTGPFRDAQHWTSNLLLERLGDRVRGTCYLVRFAIDRSTGEKKIVTLGRYEDELVRFDGSWLFAQRRVLI